MAEEKICLLIVVYIPLVILVHSQGGGTRSLTSDFTISSGCVCPEDQLTFECTSVGGVATIWHGSAFDCGSDQGGQELPGEIRLRHSQFNSQVEGQCGSNEQIVAQTVGVVNGTHFTSLLNVTVTLDMNNRTIECDTENADGSRQTIGTVMVPVATLDTTHTAEDIYLANVSRGAFTFKWSISFDPTSILTCPIDYIISTTNCGTCPTFSATKNATCQVLVAPQTAQLCTFTTVPRLCGIFYDNTSAYHIMVWLKVPDPPEIGCLPNYDGGRLSNITTTLTSNESQPFNFSRNISGSPVSYTIVYSDSTAGTTCFRVSIPASSCVRGACTHMHIFAISSSNCLPAANISVSVYSTNLLGDGPVSELITIASGLNTFTPSNGNGDLILYLVSAIITLAILLITGICVAAVSALLCLVKHKRKSNDSSNGDQPNEHENVSAAYEEIDEFRQISSIIDTSMNMAYIQITKR